MKKTLALLLCILMPSGLFASEEKTRLAKVAIERLDGICLQNQHNYENIEATVVSQGGYSLEALAPKNVTDAGGKYFSFPSLNGIGVSAFYVPNAGCTVSFPDIDIATVKALYSQDLELESLGTNETADQTVEYLKIKTQGKFHGAILATISITGTSRGALTFIPGHIAKKQGL